MNLGKCATVKPRTYFLSVRHGKLIEHKRHIGPPCRNIENLTHFVAAEDYSGKSVDRNVEVDLIIRNRSTIFHTHALGKFIYTAVVGE